MTDKIIITWTDDQWEILAQYSAILARDLADRAFNRAVDRIIETRDEEVNRGRTDCP